MADLIPRVESGSELDGINHLKLLAKNGVGSAHSQRAYQAVELVYDAQSPKPLLLAAIGAVGSIRPAEAGEILIVLADSDDEEIAEAVEEALAAEVPIDEDEDDEDSDSGY